MASAFFELELADEEPLSHATAGALLKNAVSIGRRETWKLLQETNLIFVSAPGWAEPHACSIMGTLGEVLAVALYLGNQGYHFFRKLQACEEFDRDLFVGSQHSIRAEWVTRRELTKPDRELLTALAPALPKGRPVPQFRTMRPGYHPWYITEAEGRILAECLGALDAFLQQPLPEDLWDSEGVYPLLEGGRRGTWTPPPEIPVVPVAATVDPQRLERLRGSTRRRAGTLELDHFYAPGGIGEKHCRPAFPHIAMAADRQSGIVFPPEIRLPESPLSGLLAEALWKALEVCPTFPLEVRVRNAATQAMLAPLAAALGIRLKVAASLPALEAAQESLMQHVF
jgi:hypothetical protein